MPSRRQLLETLAHHGAGIECQYVPLGHKFFATKEARDLAFSRQSKAFKAGLAPAVGPKLCLGEGREPDDRYGPFKYGYVTECVIHTGYADGEECSKEHQTLRTKIANLFGLTEWSDDHNANVGTLACGKYVAIDFGCKSYKK